MKKNSSKIIKNISFALSANFIVMFVSIFLNLFLPKYLNVDNYAYWQLYLFYFNYVGFAHLGWLDGMYLEYSGLDYDDLDKRKVSSHFWLHFLFEFCIAILFIFIVFIFSNTSEKKEILYLTIISMIISNCKTFIMYIFQSTSEIKKYSSIAKNDKFIFLFLLLLYVFMGGQYFIVLIVFDILSKLLITLYGAWQVRELIFNKIYRPKFVLKEIGLYISRGSSVMLSVLIGGLITGTSRLFIENHWDIQTFGKISFTLSISSLIMLFVNSISIVFFPLIKKVNKNNLNSIYCAMVNIFTPVIFFIMIFIFPIKSILAIWVPEYKESLFFLGIVFPSIIFESRLNLIVYNFLKKMKKEKMILFINLFVLAFSTLLSYIVIYIFDNLIYALMTLFIASVLKCLLSEMLLEKILNLNKFNFKVLLEYLIPIILVALNIYLKDIYASISYTFLLLIYFILYRKLILDTFKKIKNII